MQQAKGGILFVDEAYRLRDSKDAVEEIMLRFFMRPMTKNLDSSRIAPGNERTPKGVVSMVCPGDLSSVDPAGRQAK